MKIKFSISVILPASPNQVYNAWLSSKGHTAMTGGAAKASKRIGAKFTAWDDYISGRTLELEPEKWILQSWRTVEFGEADEDSVLEIELIPVKGGTKLTLSHSNIPEGQTEYKQGWIDHYFEPMKKYFDAIKKGNK